MAPPLPWCLLAAALLFSAASRTDANIGGGGPPDAPRFSLSQELSFDPCDEKTESRESVEFFTTDKTRADASDGGNDAARSTMAELQSSALYCSGGDLNSIRSLGSAEEEPFVTVSECRFNMAMELDSDLDEDEDEDEDTDDDDDGHSSMLSNSSLRRSLAASSGAARVFAPPCNSDGVADHNGNRKSLGARGSVPRTHSRNGVVFLARKSAIEESRHSALDTVLGVRGGAGAGAIGDPTEFAKRLLVAALVTLMYEAAAGHLLEFIKIVMQTSPPGTSYGDVMRKITGEKGIAGCWDGFVPWGVIQSIFKGGVFGLAHAMASSYLVPLADEGVLPRQVALTLAGAVAGGIQGYVLSPTLLLKTRVMTNPVFRESMSLLRTTMLSLRIGIDVVMDEGFITLMKGANVFALKRLLDWATRYFFSDLFEALLLKHSASGALTTAEKAAASLLGGTASTFSTLPLDVLVAKTQDAKKAGVKVSAFKLLKQDLEEKGWKGLTDSYLQGFEARLAHVCFTTVVMKTGGPVMYDFLFGGK